MAFKNFSQYLEDKSQEPLAGTKPPVEKVPTYKGVSPVKPPREVAPKTGDPNIKAGGAKQVGEPAPYKGTEKNKTIKMSGLDKGFVYAPSNLEPTKFDTEISAGQSYGGVPGGKPVEAAFKTAKAPGDPFQTTGMTRKTQSQLIGLNTENFVNKTKNLSLAEFTKHLHKEVHAGLEDCDCQSPHTSIKETVAACKCNKNYVSTLVREMKRNNLLNNLIAEAVNFDETFKALAHLIEQNQSCAFKMSKAMNEAVAPPIGMDSAPKTSTGPSMDDHDDSEDEDHDDHEYDDSEDAEDHEHDDDDEHGDEHGDEDHEDHDEDAEDHDDHEHDDSEDAEDHEHGDMGSVPPPEMGNAQNPPTSSPAHDALQKMRGMMHKW